MGVVSCGTTMLDQGVFENIGAVTWDTTVKTSGFTAVSGNGYFCNTTSAAFTVTLPASPSAGDIVGIKDYANTADTNNITIGRNSSNIQGEASDFRITTEGGSVLLVYIDGTKGWLVTSASQANDIVNPQFITATGGTITTSGDFKIHSFTGPGTFTVCSVGNPVGSNSIDYMVVAGGGSGGVNRAGAGAAGGLRDCTSAGFPVTAQGYPITVGAGGGAAVSSQGVQGSSSSGFSITSAGGGGGGKGCSGGGGGGPGGSGGGAGTDSGSAGPQAGGTGNTPPVSPSQGNPGGTSTPSGSRLGAGGGGGAVAAGGDGARTPSASTGGAGGAGKNLSPTFGTSLGQCGVFAGGGGGGGGNPGGTITPGVGGVGGGGAGGRCGGVAGVNGTANTGGGGGGGGPACTGFGGSGVVIIRYKFQ